MKIFRKRRVYADAAAATPLSAHARRELIRLLALAGNAGALHAEGVAARRELEAARERIASAIGAHADEIIFTASGTEANNLALQGIVRPLVRASKNAPLQRDIPRSSAEHSSSLVPHVVTTAIEHQSVLEPLRALAREGAELTEVGVDREGFVDLEQLQAALKPTTALVSVQLVNSEVGTIEPIKEIAKLLRKQGRPIYLHTDASQAPLWLELNVERLGVDLMTLDAQKVLGPKGVGCLYVRRGTDIEPVLWGGKQEQGVRAGTENVALAGSFAVALADAQQSAARNARTVAALREYVWQELKRAIPEVLLNGPKLGPGRAANNLNVSVPGLEAQMAVLALDALGVAASTRSACSIGEQEPSHVIEALGIAPELSGTAVRITLLPGATRADARRIVRAFAEAAERYKTR